MAIATLDQLIAAYLPGVPVVKAAFTGEAVGGFHSAFYLAGNPGAAAAPSPGLAGAALTSYAGQIPFPTAVGGESVYLARLDAAQAANIGAVHLVDRLWHNSGFTVTTTTAQTVNSVTWPARDRNGATLGVGVEVAVEVSTATTNGSAVTNMTMSYTNDAGTSGRTATVASFPATAVAGTFVPFLLAAGDTGVRSIQSLTLGTSLVTGTVHLVAYRKVAMLGLPVANAGAAADPIGLGLPQMYDSSVPFLVVQLVGTAAGVLVANLTYAQG
jgi:hypothetical protein